MPWTAVANRAAQQAAGASSMFKPQRCGIPSCGQVVPMNETAKHDREKHLRATITATATPRERTRDMSADNTPRAWIGCLACYSDGRLVGEWFDLDTPPESDREIRTQIHDAAGMLIHSSGAVPEGLHEELWVMDVENLPSREMSVMEARTWGERYEEVGDAQWPAFLAYDRTGLGDMAKGVTCAGSDFEDAYCGEWDSFRQFADEMADEMIAADQAGTDAGESFVARYFDYAAFARDLEMDYSTEGAPGGGVYIFRSL